MANKENYRKIYEDYFGIEIPESFDIHHIDCNHSNNEIDNLIMLPKELHQRYHNALQQLEIIDGRASIPAKINIDCESFHTKEMIELCNVLREIDKWGAFRLNLEVIQNERKRYERK